MPPWEHVDPVGLVTITSYNDAVAGGATEIATHHLDRQVASVPGSAIVQGFYDCGVEDGLRITEETTGRTEVHGGGSR